MKSQGQHTADDETERQKRIDDANSWSRKAYVAYVASQKKGEGFPQWVWVESLDMADYKAKHQYKVEGEEVEGEMRAGIRSEDASDAVKLLKPGLYCKMPGEIGYINFTILDDGSYQVEKYPPLDPNSIYTTKAAWAAAKKQEMDFIRDAGADTITISFPAAGSNWVSAKKVVRLLKMAEERGMGVELDQKTMDYLKKHHPKQWAETQAILQRLNENRLHHEILSDTSSEANLKEMRAALDRKKQKIEPLPGQNPDEATKSDIRAKIYEEGKKGIEALEAHMEHQVEEFEAESQKGAPEQEAAREKMGQNLTVWEEELTKLTDLIQKKKELESLGKLIGEKESIEKKQAELSGLKKEYKEVEENLARKAPPFAPGEQERLTKELASLKSKIESGEKLAEGLAKALDEKKSEIAEALKAPGLEAMKDMISEKGDYQAELKMHEDKHAALMEKEKTHELSDTERRELEVAKKGSENARKLIADVDKKMANHVADVNKTIQDNGGEEKISAAIKQKNDIKHGLLYGELLQSVVGDKQDEEKYSAIEKDIRDNIELRMTNIEAVTQREEAIQGGFEALLRNKEKVKDINGVETGETILGDPLSPAELAKKLSTPTPISELRSRTQKIKDRIFKRSEELKAPMQAVEEMEERFNKTKEGMDATAEAKRAERDDIKLRNQGWIDELNREKAKLAQEKKRLSKPANSAEEKTKNEKAVRELDKKVSRIDGLLGKLSGTEDRLAKDEKASNKLQQRNESDLPKMIGEVKQSAEMEAEAAKAERQAQAQSQPGRNI